MSMDSQYIKSENEEKQKKIARHLPGKVLLQLKRLSWNYSV